MEPAPPEACPFQVRGRAHSLLPDAKLPSATARCGRA
jgi:hypothetical protein